MLILGKVIHKITDGPEENGNEDTNTKEYTESKGGGRKFYDLTGWNQGRKEIKEQDKGSKEDADCDVGNDADNNNLFR